MPRSQHDRKQDCEINAAKRWLMKWGERMSRYRPVYLGEALYATHPFCQHVLDTGANVLFVVKPRSHRTLFNGVQERSIQSTGWIRTRNKTSRRREKHGYRWMSDLPIRNTDDAVRGTWVEMTVRVRQKNGSYKQTFRTSFFTSLTVTQYNVREIARCGRARWKIENECFNGITRQGQNFKHNVGHGKHGLANMLANNNLLAFTLHTVLDSVKGLWKLCRDYYVVRRSFFEELRADIRRFCFSDGCSLWKRLSGRGPPMPSVVPRV